MARGIPSGCTVNRMLRRPARTAVSADQLRRIGDLATRVPPGFSVHPKLRRLLANRREMAEGKAPIDWGGA